MLNTKFKTTMCKYYEQEKICPLGARCHFAHGKEDMRHQNDPLPNNTPLISNNKMPQNVQPMTNTMSGNNFKTVVCKYWEQGKCKYGNNCSFAHGDTEKIADHPGQMPMGNSQAMGGLMTGTGYDPLKDPQVEFMMKCQQLSMIAASLDKLHQKDSMIEQYIRSAQGMLQTNNINGAAETLQKILYNNNVGEDMKKKHEEIVQQAKKFAESAYEMLRLGQVPDFMMGMTGQGGQMNPMGGMHRN